MPTAPHLPIEPLAKHHDRASFDCGVPPLNRYLSAQAGQDAKKKIAASFVITGDDTALVAGFYTLSSTAIHVGELPASLAKKLPRYPLMPATLIGRLAVDRKFQGQGYGELLLVDALRRSLQSTKNIGSLAVLVDAKDDHAHNFYQHFQFIPLTDSTHRLFLPMAAIASYFGETP